MFGDHSDYPYHRWWSTAREQCDPDHTERWFEGLAKAGTIAGPMYLTSLIHRDRLFEIANRWLCDHVERDDGRFITEVFIYENLVSAPMLRRFLLDIGSSVHSRRIRMEHAFTKDHVRQAIIDGCLLMTPRTEALFARFREEPEEFYPRTPTNAVLAFGEDGRLLGMTRLKRIRRIAEKVSRRIADRLAHDIRKVAESLALERAERQGVPVEHLVSSDDTMAEEFMAAERMVSHAFRQGIVFFEPEEQRVDDVIGVKLIGSPEELERIESAVWEYPDAAVVKREEHTGQYNDVNLVVDLELPPVGKIVERIEGLDWTYTARRGLPPETLREDFPTYVESGARTIRVEVILTTMEELVESEFGRGIHEERIVSQRNKASYSGRIARNASDIIRYLLHLAVSPTVHVASVPIKMWGRYLPDTVSAAIWQLSCASGDGQFDSFAPEPWERLRSG